MKIKLLDDENVKFAFMKSINTSGSDADPEDTSFDLISKIIPLGDGDGCHDIVFTVNGIELDFSLVMNWLIRHYDECVMIQAKQLIKEKYRPDSLPDIDEVFTSLYNKIVTAKESIEDIQDDIDKALSIDIIKQLSR